MAAFMITITMLVAFLAQVCFATRTNYTLSGPGLLNSAVVYNPPMGDPNGWTIVDDGVMTTTAGATATFTIKSIGIYAFTNASAGASYTFKVDSRPAQSNTVTGPDFALQIPDLQLVTHTFTIANLAPGQRLTIQQIAYMDCINDQAGDCFETPIRDLNTTGPLDHLAGPIAGGIIGVVVLVVGVLLFIYHRRRQARRKAREASRRPLDFSSMRKSSNPSPFMLQRDVEAQHAVPVTFGGGRGAATSSKASMSGSSLDDVKLDDNVLAFTDADIAKITAGAPQPDLHGKGKAPEDSSRRSAGPGGVWTPPQRPAHARQPKRSSLSWSISSDSDASSR